MVAKAAYTRALTAYLQKSRDVGEDKKISLYNPFLLYCRQLAPGTVSLTGDRAQGDDSKHDSHYSPTR